MRISDDTKAPYPYRIIIFPGRLLTNMHNKQFSKLHRGLLDLANERAGRRHFRILWAGLNSKAWLGARVALLRSLLELLRGP